jgi:predicted peptidase
MYVVLDGNYKYTVIYNTTEWNMSKSDNKSKTGQGGFGLVIANFPIRIPVRKLTVLIESLVIFHSLDISAVGPSQLYIHSVPENITPLTRS